MGGSECIALKLVGQQRMGGSEGDVCIGRQRIECRAVLEGAAAAAAMGEGGASHYSFTTRFGRQL
jgi:hypothetical protein